MLREYEEIDPVILSTGEEEEVSIKQVADAIVKAMDFQGDYQVKIFVQGTSQASMLTLIASQQMDSTKADGQYRKTASNAKLIKHIPEFKFTPFESGMLRSRAYFSCIEALLSYKTDWHCMHSIE